MNGDLNEEAISIAWKSTEVSAKILKEVIRLALINRNELNHGEQSLKKLNQHNRQLESVDIMAVDMKNFRRELKRYSVDFSLKKDETGNYMVFFKGQDVDRVYKGLEKCVADFDKSTSKKKLKEIMEQAEKKAAEKVNAPEEQKDHKKERKQER